MEMCLFLCDMFMYSVSIISVDMFWMLLILSELLMYDMIPQCVLIVFFSSALIMMQLLIW